MIFEELFKKRAKDRRMDLEVVQTLCAHFGQPQLSYPTIHVAGTNGKGEVCAKIAAALESSGYRVGLFQSPHLKDFEERITINKEQIPRDYVMQKLSEVRQMDLDPQFFECASLLAWTYFRDCQVDYAVIETGLGGRLDATNVIKPQLCVITSIGKDHQEILGESLEEIALEKAGIIKAKTPIVVGPGARLAPIVERATRLQAPLYFVKSPQHFYEENVAIAKKACEVLGLSHEAIEKGMKNSLPCRFERLENVIYDVAHNESGFAYLRALLDHYYPNQTFRFVIGLSKGKNYKGCLEAILAKIKAVYFVKAQTSFSEHPEILNKLFYSLSKKPSFLAESVESGIARAKADLNPEELLVVCGSFYIMQQALCLEDGERGVCV